MKNSRITNTAAGSLRAGVAKSNITSDAKGVVINDPLYVKALVLDDGKTQVAIIAMDTTAIGGRQISGRILDDVGEDFLPKLRSRIQKKLKIPGCNVLVNASHTHPPGRLLCDDAEQVDRTFDAVRRAVRNMVPVKVGVGSGHEDRITINRDLRLKNGQDWTIRHSNPCPPDEDVAGVGPFDPEIGLKLKKASPHQHTLVVPFSNGYMHYGAPAADYSKGGYEVTECLLAPEWQRIYEKKAIEILRRLEDSRQRSQRS